MSDAVIIYPHQLCAHAPTLTHAKEAGWPIYLVEEPLILTHNPIHRQKLIFHKLTLDAYERTLTNEQYQVTRLRITDHPTTTAIFEQLRQDGVTRMHILDTADDYLERAIATCGLTRIWYESPIFLFHKNEAVERYQQSRRHLARFYKQVRKDLHILIDEQGEPIGGQWSFDKENRQNIPQDMTLPPDISHYGNNETVAAADWADSINCEQYGEPGCWLPYTHEGAQKFLKEFLRDRFSNFGPYEDALHTEGVRLWHSTLSPLLNVGLLTPQEVLDAALTYADKNDVPLNSLEGFVRQLIGWREFIRASYVCDGARMRSSNFFSHTHSLPDSFWSGTTGLAPVDHVISTVLAYAYTHHIERLMVMGNIMLLSRIHPDEVYRWFMALYIDAYDWVMVPNVYGMSQFADGGSFATKPYISGANYIKKMSNFPSGDWEETWTALYWYFVETHQEFFSHNHRLAMMPRMLARMDSKTRDTHISRAIEYLKNWSIN